MFRALSRLLNISSIQPNATNSVWKIKVREKHERRRKMKLLDVIAAFLLVVGGLNWGLVGLFQFDLVATIFGSQSAFLARIIYLMVGFSALYQAMSWKAIQHRWTALSARA